MDASFQRFAIAVPPGLCGSLRPEVRGPRGLLAQLGAAVQEARPLRVFAAAVQTDPAKGLAWRGIPLPHFSTTPHPLSMQRPAPNAHSIGPLMSRLQAGCTMRTAPKPFG